MARKTDRIYGAMTDEIRRIAAAKNEFTAADVRYVGSVRRVSQMLSVMCRWGELERVRSFRGRHFTIYKATP